MNYIRRFPCVFWFSLAVIFLATGAWAKFSLEDQLIGHEGLEKCVYEDTQGQMTIGVGRNLTANGISREEALFLLQNDVAEAIADLESLPFWLTLNEARQRVLIDIRFNVGPSRFIKFKKLREALEAGDYGRAAKEIRNSKLSKYRRTRLAEWMESGVLPEESCN